VEELRSNGFDQPPTFSVDSPWATFLQQSGLSHPSGGHSSPHAPASFSPSVQDAALSAQVAAFSLALGLGRESDRLDVGVFGLAASHRAGLVLTGRRGDGSHSRLDLDLAVAGTSQQAPAGHGLVAADRRSGHAEETNQTDRCDLQN
jgi:hypothetical protein